MMIFSHVVLARDSRLQQLSSQVSSTGNEGVILGNYNGQIALKAGTPEKLVEALYVNWIIYLKI